MRLSFKRIHRTTRGMTKSRLAAYCTFGLAVLLYHLKSAGQVNYVPDLGQGQAEISALAYTDWDTVYDAPGGRKIKASVHLRGDSGYYILKDSGARGILSNITYYELFDHNQVLNIQPSRPTPAITGIFNLFGKTGFFVFREPDASGTMDGYCGSWVTDNRRIYLSYGGSWDGKLLAKVKPAPSVAVPETPANSEVIDRDAPKQPARDDKLVKELEDVKKTVHSQAEALRIAAIETAALREAFERLAAGGRQAPDAPIPEGFEKLPPPPNGAGLQGGSDEVLSFAYRKKLEKSCKFVCRFVAKNDFVHPILGRHTRGGGVGTGVLVGPSLVLTCNHVIPTDNVAGSVAIQFDEGAEKVEFSLAPIAVLQSSPVDKLDYSLLRVAVDVDEPPSAMFNHCYLETSIKHRNSLLFENLRVNIIHYPNGRENQAYDIRGLTLKLHKGSYVLYDLNTELGSSGAPVFNDYWWLIAIHQGKFKGNADRSDLGQGISVTAIIDDIRNNAGQQLLQELRLK